MLNKVILKGEFILPEKQETIDDYSQREKMVGYFSLLVPTPRHSTTAIRCIALKDITDKLNEEVRNKEIIKVKGYLRNERIGRQILVKVTYFEKLNISREDIDIDNANLVRLTGKIVSDIIATESKNKAEKIFSFKLLVPQPNSERNIYFCRISNKLIDKFSYQLSRNFFVLIEGFLQTKSVKDENDKWKKENNDQEFNDDDNKKRKNEKISSVVVRSIIVLDHNDLHEDFLPLDKLELVTAPIEIIDFSKPPKESNDQ